MKRNGGDALYKIAREDIDDHLKASSLIGVEALFDRAREDARALHYSIFLVPFVQVKFFCISTRNINYQLYQDYATLHILYYP